MNPTTPTLSFIGCGHLGKTLGRLWTRAGILSVQDILTRSTAGAAEAAAYVGAGRPVADYADLEPADIFLIATPDDSVGAACEALAGTGLPGPGSIVFHCSGSLPSSVLAAASRCGAAVASLHPIRSFAAPDRVAENFAGTYCGTEGDEAALTVLVPAFAAIGAHPVSIDAGRKVLYHAAAVFAANYLSTLLGVAQDAYVATGVAPDEALKMMEPLVRESIDNIFRLGPARALSGPIARGDMETVERQQQAVAAWRPEYGELYRQFVGLTCELAAKRKAGPCGK
ncbi:MAG TPA: Rossmann-like and DUF2520 domain-containing protein [Paucimonas sp.]|nr:Rossmann-like and DUF2520 domain-containing protein [Paucimonas sp.]